MQLFLLDHIDLKGKDIIIDNPELWQQAKKVLRLSSGDQIFVQVENTRHEIEITKLQDLKIFGQIKNSSTAPQNNTHTSMIISMPNKREKAELIVQKLTEIGINEIVFRPSERSIIKEWNANKAARLEKIMKEAVEQSRGRHLPNIFFEKNIEKTLAGKKMIVFDKQNDGANDVILNPPRRMKDISSKLDSSAKPQNDTMKEPQQVVTGIIGSEGGRGPKDYELFKKHTIETMGLGATVLRMETAAIVGAWVVKNLL